MIKRVIFRTKLLPYLLVAPQIAITLIFFIWPAAQAVKQSVYIEGPFGGNAEFVWLENFAALFTDPNYLHSVRVTIVFSTAVTFFGLAISLRAGGDVRFGSCVDGAHGSRDFLAFCLRSGASHVSGLFARCS